MKENFDKCLSEVLKHEGGWSDHPSDPGGATMRGITIGTFAQFKGRKVTKQELRNISDADLQTIYKRKYWDVVRGDELPSGLDLVVFDAAVNSGPTRSAKQLQIALNVTPDGKIGPVTLAHAKSAPTHDLIDATIDARLRFLKNLKTWATFGKGWSRRVESVRRVAHEMAPASLTSEALKPTTGPAPEPVSGPVSEPTPKLAPRASGFWSALWSALWSRIVSVFPKNG